MIAQLSGTIIHAENRSLIVDVSGVGYRVFCTGETVEKAALNKPIRLWTYLAVRENALDLYGFIQPNELDFFELLIGVSGIGPKSALSILNLATLATLEKAITSEDAGYLTKVSGIGKRNAEKIVLELKDKVIATYGEAESATARNHEDTLAALQALGYAEREARDALKKVPHNVTDTGERVKQALKILAKQN